MVDFFISYTSSDAAWAEWVAWHLEEHGYDVLIQQWDFKPGDNFVVSIQNACNTATTTLAILSEEYLEQVYTVAEWTAAFTKSPDGKNRNLIPIRVTKVKPDGLLSAVVYIDLSDVSTEEVALQKLLKGVSKKRIKPELAPQFPLQKMNNSSTAPIFPATNKQVQNASICARRFVCQKISRSQLLNLENIDHPYNVYSDPTEFIEINGKSAVNCVLWLPVTKYIQECQLQKYTPAVAICFDGNSCINNDIKLRLNDDLGKLLSIRASKLRNDERERLFLELGALLHEAFIAAITLPEIMLIAGKNNPTIAYTAFLDMLLLPLVQMHKKHGVDMFNLILPRIEEQSGSVRGSVISTSKKILKAIYHEKGSFKVVETIDNENWPVITETARLIAWGVNVSHNQQNDKWLLYFEKGIEEAVSSQLDETASGLTSLS